MSNRRPRKPKNFYDFSQPPEIINWANDVTDEYVYTPLGSGKAKKVSFDSSTLIE
jgi:hypothetical protein